MLTERMLVPFGKTQKAKHGLAAWTLAYTLCVYTMAISLERGKSPFPLSPERP